MKTALNVELVVSNFRECITDGIILDKDIETIFDMVKKYESVLIYLCTDEFVLTQDLVKELNIVFGMVNSIMKSKCIEVDKFVAFAVKDLFAYLDKEGYDTYIAKSGCNFKERLVANEIKKG